MEGLDGKEEVECQLSAGVGLIRHRTTSGKTRRLDQFDVCQLDLAVRHRFAKHDAIDV